MSITPEEIAAYADGELDAARAEEIAAAIAADPQLAEQLRAHRALRERLSAHFAPVLDAPVPERLTRPLRAVGNTVVSLSAARQERKEQEQRKAARLPRWTWVAGPALAASLALAVFLPRGSQASYADGALATTLDQQLVSAQAPQAPNRILLSFRDDSGAFCRAFAAPEQSGIACRDEQGWRLVYTKGGIETQDSEYRMAGNPASATLERAQALATGPALDAAEERAARARGWRYSPGNKPPVP